jgi:hypothetical protein
VPHNLRLQSEICSHTLDAHGRTVISASMHAHTMSSGGRQLKRIVQEILYNSQMSQYFSTILCIKDEIMHRRGMQSESVNDATLPAFWRCTHRGLPHSQHLRSVSAFPQRLSFLLCRSCSTGGRAGTLLAPLRCMRGGLERPALLVAHRNLAPGSA